MCEDLVSLIRAELLQNADDETRESAQRFFREPVRLYGVRTPVVREIARRHFRVIRHMRKREIFELCEDLLETDYTEDAIVAFDWAYSLRRSYEPPDFQVFERWVTAYINNWVKCDTFCNHSLGTFVEMYPAYIQNLKSWSASENRWVRRAAAATMILPARRGLFLSDVLEIADMLLRDADDMVQKGCGWLLKEASRCHQQEVFNYVMSRKNEMPRTTLRYAIEKMPPDMRRLAMERPR
ncbi:MAG: DNA alkylation repair protein [Methanothrix sp.]|uniref:DNA alkylation repair protein n=1 Tax=Methanothrix sp. TaxID=90426 RepID=UPI0025FCBC0F|nr:DNA alkylation repair protein [Methanothrix sp.]MCQ8902721.1 DNA alkylation repair protein [Methanothrix sp.]